MLGFIKIAESNKNLDFLKLLQADCLKYGYKLNKKNKTKKRDEIFEKNEKLDEIED
jgi:hypothetical protein